MTAFFMANRIATQNTSNFQELINAVYTALQEISFRRPQDSAATQASLYSCCNTLAGAGTKSIIVQKQVQDPDYMAEYSAYYSRQFSNVGRLCTRLHFFTLAKPDHQTDIEFIDSLDSTNYLGFITLRPVIKSPVGASIISKTVAPGFIRSADEFPVHLAGKEFVVCGTPFMQQDNAVGACAQASIWMALRTLRKREGDRAHNPAQITDAATRYAINGRIKPNREGLTQHQMVEAIRAAGYSPHSIYIAEWNSGTVMTDDQVKVAMRRIHPYIESEIPVILILSTSVGGHAVVAIGHSWNKHSNELNCIELKLKDGTQLQFLHTATWIPEFLIHNDNSGPYLGLQNDPAGSDYSIQQVVSAIPLLPADVFMSGEEALSVGLTLLEDLFEGFKENLSSAALTKAASEIAIRLLIVEKRKLRGWAANTAMDAELQNKLRLMYLPRRVWILELHLQNDYGSNDTAPAHTLVGFILIDPTGDIATDSLLMMYLSANFPVNLPVGVMALWDKNGLLQKGIQVTNSAPLLPIRA